MATNWRNQPAFPSASGDEAGLTKFEYIATVALQGLLADPHYDADAAVRAALNAAERLSQALEERAADSGSH